MYNNKKFNYNMFWLPISSQIANHKAKYVYGHLLISKDQNLLLHNYILPKLVKHIIV